MSRENLRFLRGSVFGLSGCRTTWLLGGDYKMARIEEQVQVMEVGDTIESRTGWGKVCPFASGHKDIIIPVCGDAKNPGTFFLTCDRRDVVYCDKYRKLMESMI